MNEGFRYYRWRTLYGTKLWSLDAEFYVLLGQLHLRDLGEGGDVFCRADLLRLRMSASGVYGGGVDETLLARQSPAEPTAFVGVDVGTNPSRTVIAKQVAAKGEPMKWVVIDDVTPSEKRATDEELREFARGLQARGT
jgi:hypothetical protein